jgi:hypothetical protein
VAVRSASRLVSSAHPRRRCYHETRPFNAGHLDTLEAGGGHLVAELSRQVEVGGSEDAGGSRGQHPSRDDRDDAGQLLGLVEAVEVDELIEYGGLVGDGGGGDQQASVS